MQIPPSPPKAQSECASDGDDNRFDSLSNTSTATGKATDLISANQVNANADTYEEVRLAA